MQEEIGQNSTLIADFMQQFTAYFAERTLQHTIEPNWFESQPHPKRFNQGNAQRCIYCSMLIGYSYRGKDYGPDFMQEIARCPLKPMG